MNAFYLLIYFVWYETSIGLKQLSTQHFTWLFLIFVTGGTSLAAFRSN